MIWLISGKASKHLWIFQTNTFELEFSLVLSLQTKPQILNFPYLYFGSAYDMLVLISLKDLPIYSLCVLHLPTHLFHDMRLGLRGDLSHKIHICILNPSFHFVMLWPMHAIRRRWASYLITNTWRLSKVYVPKVCICRYECFLCFPWVS